MGASIEPVCDQYRDEFLSWSVPFVLKRNKLSQNIYKCCKCGNPIERHRYYTPFNKPREWFSYEFARAKYSFTMDCAKDGNSGAFHDLEKYERDFLRARRALDIVMIGKEMMILKPIEEETNALTG